MSATLAAQAGRTVDRIAVVSAIGHALVAALAIFLVGQSDDSTTYGLLAAFAALGLIATLLGWASVKAGRAVWSGGVAVLLISLGVLAWALPGEGGLGVASIAIPLLFMDWLLFANARKALSRP